MTVETYTGQALPEGLYIATETNPWIELNGTACNWAKLPYPRNPKIDCPQCGNILPGVIEAMDTDEGIQRCDECQVYEDDLDAALALAEWLGGGVVRFYAMRICRHCGTRIEWEHGADAWVDLRSGDQGGTYDHCPDSPNNRHYPTTTRR